MFLDIGLVLLITLGYLIAIVMALKTKRSQEINIVLSDSELELIAQKVADKILSSGLVFSNNKGLSDLGPFNSPVFIDNGCIPLDESPIVIKSNTDGLSVGSTDLGKEEKVKETISSSTLAELKRKKKE